MATLFLKLGRLNIPFYDPRSGISVGVNEVVQADIDVYTEALQQAFTTGQLVHANNEEYRNFLNGTLDETSVDNLNPLETSPVVKGKAFSKRFSKGFK